MRVIKLGGSLLDVPNLGARLDRWCQRQPPMVSIVVVGGGASVDVLRELDRTNNLDASTAHWLAIRAMQQNARIVETLLPEALWVDSFGQIFSCDLKAGILIADPWRMLTEVAASGALSLPESWDVTSDSISAWFAARLAAEELVLLKSALLPTIATVEEASACGYVDAYFKEAVARFAHIRCVNLRDDPFEESILKEALTCNVTQRDS